MQKEIIDPADMLGEGDPGDETLRAFRYQHAYGAILLIAGAAKREPYSAIWCEHHEDLLAERTDGSYDAYQIKTRQPERGYWKNDADELQSSIRKFLKLHEQFGTKIRVFVFLSNADFFKCGLNVKESTLKTSPVRFLEAVYNVDDYDSLTNPFRSVFDDLVTEYGCDNDSLLGVLKRTYLKKGPSRDDFDADIAHNHLTQIDKCATMGMALLNAIRDELIQQVYQASSLKIEDAGRYLLNIEKRNDPRLLSKRVALDAVTQAIELSGDLVFRYQPVDLTIDLKKDAGSTSVLEKKFVMGNLADQFQTMKRRKISAEQRLLELAAMSPEKFPNILGQLESVVQAECDEAMLNVKTEGNETLYYGPQMLKAVFDKLKKVAETQPTKVSREAYETLVGMAALLTENCSVWWSDKFDLKDVA